MRLTAGVASIDREERPLTAGRRRSVDLDPQPFQHLDKPGNVVDRNSATPGLHGDGPIEQTGVDQRESQRVGYHPPDRRLSGPGRTIDRDDHF